PPQRRSDDGIAAHGLRHRVLERLAADHSFVAIELFEDGTADAHEMGARFRSHRFETPAAWPRASIDSLRGRWRVAIGELDAVADPRVGSAAQASEQPVDIELQPRIRQHTHLRGAQNLLGFDSHHAAGTGKSRPARERYLYVYRLDLDQNRPHLFLG